MSTCICFLFFILRTCHTLYHIHLCHSLQAADPPGWLYLRNTQTPSALISFFCCATPHKQEKNQEKKNHQNNKSPNIHSVQCSAETILFKHLKACKAYSHEETSSQKKKKKDLKPVLLYFHWKVLLFVEVYCAFGFFPGLVFGFCLQVLVVFFLNKTPIFLKLFILLETKLWHRQGILPYQLRVYF